MQKEVWIHRHPVHLFPDHPGRKDVGEKIAHLIETRRRNLGMCKGGKEGRKRRIEQGGSGSRGRP